MPFKFDIEQKYMPKYSHLKMDFVKLILEGKKKVIFPKNSIY